MAGTFKIIVPILFFFSPFLRAQTTTDAELPKGHKDTKITNVVIIEDSIPASELLKRAVIWVQTESLKYGKTSGITTGSKAECNVVFPVKPKELNPVCDYTGKITMKVIVECKDNKYKYTVEHIKHSSTTGKASMGSIDNIIPECGSMVMPDLTQKKLKGEALKYAGLIVGEIKESMKKPSDEAEKQEW